MKFTLLNEYYYLDLNERITICVSKVNHDLYKFLLLRVHIQ